MHPNRKQKYQVMKRLWIAISHISLWLFIAPAAYSQETLADRLKNHVYTLADDSLGGRQAGSEFARKAADYIVEQWEDAGITPWNGTSYFKPFRGNQYNNLVGIIEGNHPVLKDEYIIIGAHYDHLGSKEDKNGGMAIYNGADDNASGTATIIELGRKLKAIQPTLGRSIVLIAFDAEEIGLYGSNDFAANPPFPIEKVKLMFSVDMVGWYKAAGYVMYIGSGTIRNGKETLADSKLIPEGLHVKTQSFERSILTATDTDGFARKGIPTLDVTTGLKSPYHKPEDVAELIDYEGMALITEHLTNVVHAFSADEDYQSSGKFAAKHHSSKFNWGMSAHIGSNFHYYTSGALDGKPAGAYGIGLSAEVNLGVLAIRPEVYYNFIQAHHPDGKLNTHSVTVPLNLLLQTPSSSIAGAAVFAGPYYSYKFNGRQGGVALDFENLFYREEVGINYGIELRVSIIRIGVTRRQAFTNFTRMKNEDGAHIRNRSYFTSLSFMF